MSYELIAAKRVEQGTGASRRLRRAGKLPAVVYGAGKDAEAVVLEHNPVFYALKDEAFHTSVLELVVDGDKQQVLVRDYQMHPFKQQVLHIDFQRVNANEKIHVRVPLHFVGAEVSPAVKLHGGKVAYIANSVDVSALPGQLPKFIEVDLSNAVGGQNVRASDLKLPEGVELVALGRGDNATLVTISGKAPEAAAE
ncbi:LSU ribosomal protein L25P [Crenobacter luteus]|uniref:Large ribosomal subunit protein bL25 n=1 Tax=Crenobacter luteus TaxID=1452487 RepID=A0A163CXS1_9NEIS|nr:50S ribosomal protein L25/general stress protein Ctc [Crenobacter luteus]KZE33431.1 50S ribosomal protein L25/general stress protein Ctc [Crenobacter luteus]TCP10944.1 LSU ribosomal protein L25P [Crenobacter luteus]